MPQIEIAKPGKFRATNGRTYEYTADDLRACAAAYSPELHESPLVVGHPKTNGPAYGWVKGVEFKNDRLRIDADRMSPEFAEMAKNAFPKRSASFYMPDHPQNPTPGTMYLRHVGFLGATPPAIKGLAELPADFGEPDDDVVAVDFAESDLPIARLFRNIRDYFIGSIGEEEADKVLPSWELDHIQEVGIREQNQAAPAFAEPEAPSNTVSAEPEVAVPPATSKPDEGAEKPVPAEGSTETLPAGETPATKAPEPQTEAPEDPRAKELTEKEAALAKREQELLAKEAKARGEHLASFCEQIVASGRALPCDSAQLVAFMHRLDGVGADEDIASFGESDERSALEFFQESVLKRLPVTVDFAERAPGDGHDLDAANSFDVLDSRVKDLISEARGRGEYLSSVDAMKKIKG